MEKILINNGVRELHVTPKVYRVVFKSQGYREGGLKVGHPTLDLGEVEEKPKRKRAPRKKVEEVEIKVGE